MVMDKSNTNSIVVKKPINTAKPEPVSLSVLQLCLGVCATLATCAASRAVLASTHVGTPRIWLLKERLPYK